MRTFATVVLLAVLGLGSQSATATDCTGGSTCCDQCGCHVACVQKTCQVVCGVKKETKTRWSVECQEFCPLMPGHHQCCDECQPPPRCGHLKCVKKLVKKEYQVEVPIYKCVMRNLCPDCCKNGATAPTNTAPDPPPAPAAPPVPPAPSVPTPPSNPK